MEMVSLMIPKISFSQTRILPLQAMNQRLQEEVYTPIEMWRKQYQHMKVTPISCHLWKSFD